MMMRNGVRGTGTGRRQEGEMELQEQESEKGKEEEVVKKWGAGRRGRRKGRKENPQYTNHESRKVRNGASHRVNI